MRHNRYYLPKSGRKRRAQPARSVHGAAAWGVIPLYINEFIPGQVRALLPGFAYQVGIRVASSQPSSWGYDRDRSGAEAERGIAFGRDSV